MSLLFKQTMLFQTSYIYEEDRIIKQSHFSIMNKFIKINIRYLYIQQNQRKLFKKFIRLVEIRSKSIHSNVET